MERMWDAVVVGLGAMGMSTLWQLATRGARVLGVERHSVAHDRGSSHGGSRIVRKAYFEHTNYVPLLTRADELWGELERESRTRIVHRCGVLYGGASTSSVLGGVKSSAAMHAIDIESLTPTGAARRFPALLGCAEPVDEFLLEPNAGFARPERAITAMANVASRAGAHIRLQARVDSWREDDGTIEVCMQGRVERAHTLILAAGAWTPTLLPDTARVITNTRQVMAWVTPRAPGSCDEHSLPAFFIERDAGPPIYGVPMASDQPGEQGVKVGFHGGGSLCDPDSMDRVVTDAERMQFSQALARAVPGAAGSVSAARVCIYSSSPDDHFIIDRVSTSASVFAAFGMGGHGFKFSPVIGSALADLAMTGHTELPIGFLGKKRLGLG
jgi:sarcosine oxidase